MWSVCFYFILQMGEILIKGVGVGVFFRGSELRFKCVIEVVYN